MDILDIFGLFLDILLKPPQPLIGLFLKDFFQATIGVPYAIIIISPTECMFFTPGRSKELGMSYEDSRANCQQLNGSTPGLALPWRSLPSRGW